MLGTNVIGSEQRDELRRSRSFFYVGATARFLAFHQAKHAGDLKSELTRRLNGLDGRSPRGADVIHDDHPRRLLPKTFDALGHAVGFLRFAHQKTMRSERGRV